MKILFVTANLGYSDNIGIAYLSAIAKLDGHKTFYCSIDKNDLILQIKQIKPDIVGYSVNIEGYEKIFKINKEAKSIFKFLSIMGGPYPTGNPGSLIESGADAYCIGEGEYAFRDILRNIQKKKSIDNIKNIVTLKNYNEVRPLIYPLDQLPMPDRDLILGSTFLSSTEKKTFMTSRGCPYACSYCCNNRINHLYKNKGKIVRRFSVKRIIDEIKDIRSKYTMKFIKFDDDCFAFKVDDWLKEFCNSYKESIGLPFNCILRLDLVTEELLDLLKDAGCVSVHLSIDSISKHVRDNIFKRKMNSDIKSKTLLIRSKGIDTYANFMTAAPESTIEDDLSTIRFAKECRLTYPAFTTTIPLKGTDLYDYCYDHNLIDIYDKDLSFYAPSKLSCFSKKEQEIRFNVNLMGAFLTKMPIPIDIIGVQLLRIIPNNKFFKKMYKFMYNHYMTKRIYRVK